MVVVHGDVSPGYEAVREAFVENFRSRGEVGAAVAVVIDNQVVVDLWGGSANPRRRRPWQRDTLVNLFSTTKGLSALAVAHAHSQGLFEYDEPVATYWPEFAANGKQHVTARTLLSHQAGLCAIDAPMTVATLADPDAVAAAIGPQRPAWTPGERHGYHAITLGWYESELIRRTDPQHRTIGRYFAEEIAEPLGLDLYIGLPDEVPDQHLARIMGDWYRVKMLLHLRTMPRRFVTNFLNPRSITARSFANPKVVGEALRYNDRAIRRLELPSSNGTGTARSVAAAYGEFAMGGRRLGIDELTLAALTRPATAPSGGRYDQVLHTNTALLARSLQAVARLRVLTASLRHPGRGRIDGLRRPTAEDGILLRDEPNGLPSVERPPRGRTAARRAGRRRSDSLTRRPCRNPHTIATATACARLGRRMSKPLAAEIRLINEAAARWSRPAVSW
jgi:CubicO group peptidase (beta-lactamase class C family)